VEDRLKHVCDLLESSDYRQAIEELDGALQNHPGEHRLLALKARALWEIGDVEGARDCIERVMERSTDSPENWILMGMVQSNLGLYQRALSSFDQAIGLEDSLPEPWIKKGLILQKIGKLEYALDCFDKATDINPNHVDVWNYIGITYERMGNKNRAEEAFRRALDLNPINPEAKDGLKRIKTT
jgi:tetratricopeptide (TPR) repeat protein